MTIDSHVHTHYSHGNSEVYKIVLEAIKKNINGIGFCEHFHYDYFNDLGFPVVGGREIRGTLFEDFKLYYNSVCQAKVDFHGQINIMTGLEVDYLQSKEVEIRQALDIRPFEHDYKEVNPERKFEFDFVMGATHFIGQPLKYISDYKFKGDAWMIEEYFSSVEASIKSGLFDIIAHPELIKYFVDVDFENYRDKIERITDLLAVHKVAIDVNTDYMKNPKTEVIEKSRLNPGIKMLLLCKEKNIPMVLGSDAHGPDKLANNFELAIEILKEIGINQLHYFKKRDLIAYDI